MTDKAQQRRQALKLRAALSDMERAERSALICRALTELPELKEAKVIFSYLAAGSEADMGLFNSAMKSRGTIVAFPVSMKGGIMEAYEPGELKKGLYGITEPVKEKSRLIYPQEIDAVIVPCLAFDDKGGRMGHGGGYYDRYLPSCRCLKIVAGFEAQRLEEIIRDEHDVKMDMAVSEERLYRFI